MPCRPGKYPVRGFGEGTLQREEAPGIVVVVVIRSSVREYGISTLQGLEVGRARSKYPVRA